MAPIDNRRHQRSRDPLVALHYQLAQVRQEASLDAIVVADDAGVVVAGAGAWATCEELAAYAPLLARSADGEPDAKGGEAPSRIAQMRAHVDIHQLAVEGQTVWVCASGGARRAAALKRAAAGIARILRREPFDDAPVSGTPTVAARA